MTEQVDTMSCLFPNSGTNPIFSSSNERSRKCEDKDQDRKSVSNGTRNILMMRQTTMRRTTKEEMRWKMNEEKKEKKWERDQIAPSFVDNFQLKVVESELSCKRVCMTGSECTGIYWRTKMTHYTTYRFILFRVSRAQKQDGDCERSIWQGDGVRMSASCYCHRPVKRIQCHVDYWNCGDTRSRACWLRVFIDMEGIDMRRVQHEKARKRTTYSEFVRRTIFVMSHIIFDAMQYFLRIRSLAGLNMDTRVIDKSFPNRSCTWWS